MRGVAKMLEYKQKRNNGRTRLPVFTSLGGWVGGWVGGCICIRIQTIEGQ